MDMTIDILPDHKNGHLCIDDIIMLVARYFKKNYIFMYTKGLNFSYSPHIIKGKGMLEQIRTSCNYPTRLSDFSIELAYLKDYVGLDIEYKSGLEKEKTISYIIENVKNNRPVAVISDTYYIPWYNKYYQKVNKLHTFLVVNVIDGFLLCVDGYLSHRPIEFLPIDLLVNKGTLAIQPIEPQEKLSLCNILNHIVRLLKINHKLENCDCIRRFADDVKDISFLNSERQIYADLDCSDFMVGLKSIEFGRANIKELFHYLSDIFTSHKDSLLLIESKIQPIVEQWKLVQRIINNCYIKQRPLHLH